MTIAQKIERIAAQIGINGSAAFASKKNALLFARLVRARGFSVFMRRSSGPTVDGGFTKAYFVQVWKKNRPAKKRAPRRQLPGIYDPNFRF